ncbi:PAQR family membrane homeostasis protein TrhA [Lawsonibacter sp. LCP25S3_G6]|uniref:PAQR family membrane homeostasis protein TrhA n=1 Tax=unclassified Lawsonibacter TaxID=2617946 RepID=UPI003F998288
MRADVLSASAAPLAISRPKRRREVRDPYDGLRPWSAITHGIGAVLAGVGTVLLLIRAGQIGNGSLMVLFVVYGLSMFCLYTASTLYHCLRTSVAGRIALRKYDHCSIYLLIAGSYTPLCLTALRESGGIPLLVAVWTLAAAGVVLTIAKLAIPRWLTSAIYLFMGWLVIFAIVPIYEALPYDGFLWLLAGGLLYTIGGVLYAVKWPGRSNPRFGCHEIFHVFILLGSACHFVLMYQIVPQL